MKTAVLVNPPNHKDDLGELAPPLGLLVLAGVARRAGWNCRILDLALLDVGLTSVEEFYIRSCNAIMSGESIPDAVCLTSMGINTHVSLELARRVKLLDRSVVTCVGGVHASSIAREMYELYPWVDAVILGEGERAFEKFLGEVEAIRRSGDRPGIYVTNGEATTPIHPFESYELVRLEDYFTKNGARSVVNYEGGRGCVFRCAFCYSPSHYSGVREVPASQVVSDWATLVGHGASHVFMVQDNFTNSPKHAVDVCNALEAADLPLTWNGYATLPQVNTEVIDGLARSKCSAIYLGIDAVSDAQRVKFRKRFYHGDTELLEKVILLRERGVVPTCAFILDMFEYVESDFEEVLRVAAACASVGAAIRINTFTRYAGSRLGVGVSNKARYSEAKMRIMYDCPEVVAQNHFGIESPVLFPFHATEVEDEHVWESRLRLVWLAQRLVQRYPDEFCEMIRRRDGSVVAGIRALVEAGPELDLLHGVSEAELW